jgi:hypothetical protein
VLEDEVTDKWPKDYTALPFPSLPNKEAWEGTVAARARILDPDFHGGKTEAIRLVVEWKEEELELPPFAHRPARKWVRRTAIPGDWIEFRNFKEANQFVQAYKRLEQ